MLDGQPKSETALNITNSNQADTTTPYVATIGSTDDSIYVDVKPVIIDVCGGVDCPGTLAPKSTELSDTVLDEMALKDEYKCTCNDDKATTECLNVEASSLNVDEVATVDGIKEENLLSSTTSEASTTTSCNERDSRYRSVEQIFFSSHLNQHYSAYYLQYICSLIDVGFARKITIPTNVYSSTWTVIATAGCHIVRMLIVFYNYLIIIY